MAQDDPFASPDTDRTVIIPSPGRRSAAPVQPVQPVSPAATPRMEMSGSVLAGGLNPLIAAANPLLDLVPQLRSTLQHADPSGLRDFLAQREKAQRLALDVAAINQHAGKLNAEMNDALSFQAGTD